MSDNAYDRHSYAGAAPDTTLSSSISDTDLTVTCADLTGWPDGTGGNFVVIFEPGKTAEEKCLASSRSGNVLTLVSRGMEGAPAAHNATTTTVRHGFSARDANEANYAVHQTVGQITAAGDLLQGTSANTLEKISVGATGKALVVAAGKWVAGLPTMGLSDITGLVNALAGKLATPATAIAKGSLLVGTGANVADSVAVGADNTVLTADSTATGGVSWQTSPALAPLSTVDYTGTTASLHVNASGSPALTVVDSTNLSPSFTVPTSGKVLVRVSGVWNKNSTALTTVGVGWLNHTGGTQVGRTQTDTIIPVTSFTVSSQRFSVAQTLTGLSAGTLRLDLAIGTVNASNNPCTLSDVTIEVWAA